MQRVEELVQQHNQSCSPQYLVSPSFLDVDNFAGVPDMRTGPARHDERSGAEHGEIFAICVSARAAGGQGV